MKMPKIMRPEIDIEYIGVKGFIAALYAICRVGIQKRHIDCLIKHTNMRNLDFSSGSKFKRHYFYIIPKYKLKKVSEFSKREGETE